MLNEKKDWMVKSSYWGNWSRSLQRMGGDYNSAVELSLTPINGFPSEWKDINLIKVRRHVTGESKMNFVHNLPNKVYQFMASNLGESVSGHLFNFDFFDHLDPIKLIRLDQITGGGGVPMALLDYSPYPNKLTLDLFNEHGGNFKGLKEEHDKLFNQEQNIIQVGHGVPGLPKGSYRYYGTHYDRIDVSKTNGKAYIGHTVTGHDVLYVSPLRSHKSKDTLLGIRKVYMLFIVNNCVERVHEIKI